MFTPVRVLSSGGPVRVELARWRGKLVVVKQLQGASPVLANRLGREAAVVTHLEHDHIVPLLAVQDTSLIYAYCPGITLSEALQEGPLSVTLSVRVTTDVLLALEYAHAKNVIHLDVKPSNILINGDKAMLTDFGFAKDLALAAITQQGMSLGTPNYMAPEQFVGERSDPRSDLYAVGAVLYHLLTGAPPYERDLFRFLTGDRSVALEPLPEGAAALQGVVTRALEYNPDRRFASASDMLRALRAAFSGPLERHDPLV
jgi:serine/threonine protein kinase